MKRSIAFLLSGIILLIWFGGSINILIRYNLNWIDYMKYSFSLSGEQRTYLNATEIICGVTNHDLPLSFTNDEGQNDGMFFDFISQLSVELENSMTIRTDRSEKLEEMLTRGEVQAIVTDKSQLSRDNILYSEPLYITHGKMLVKDDSPLENINQLSNGIVAVEQGDTAMAERILELYGKNKVKVVYIENFEEALKMLSDGTIMAAAGDETKLAYLLNQKDNRQSYRFLKYSFSRKEICIAVESSNQLFLGALNKAILSMKKKNLISKTQNKWFGFVAPEIMDMNKVGLIYKVALAFILCGAAFTLWNLSTAKKVTEKTRELFNSQEQLRLIIDTLDQGLVITDKNGRIIEANDRICQIADASKSSLLQTSIFWNSKILPFVSSDDEKIFRRKDRYYLKKEIELNEDAKKLYIVEDCTQRHINEIRNIQEQKMIAVGQLSAGFAHEIRNPLGLIKSYLFVIKEFCVGEDGEHAVHVIDDSIKRINGLIESLLKFSRLSGNELKQVDIGELINNILFLEKKQLEKKNIEAFLYFETQEERTVFINEDLLKITIINLLNNSIDALENCCGEKRIEMKVSLTENTVKLTFKDTGCGVEEDKLLAIFNPFYTSKEKGTGLGLYIVQSQLEQAGGSIRAESIERDGTVFYVEIPIKKE